MPATGGLGSGWSGTGALDMIAFVLDYSRSLSAVRSSFLVVPPEIIIQEFLRMKRSLVALLLVVMAFAVGCKKESNANTETAAVDTGVSSTGASATGTTATDTTATTSTSATSTTGTSSTGASSTDTMATSATTGTH